MNEKFNDLDIIDIYRAACRDTIPCRGENIVNRANRMIKTFEMYLTNSDFHTGRFDAQRGFCDYKRLSSSSHYFSGYYSIGDDVGRRNDDVFIKDEKALKKFLTSKLIDVLNFRIDNLR